jgi:2,4-dienoyl-CoA reductase-like NADH-dependent reductase (Old Yellow Enzyme family)
MDLRNRVVRSATWEGLAARDGSATPQLDAMLSDLAAGEAGLVISGYAFVSHDGQDEEGQLGAYSDELVPGLARTAAEVHAAGGRIALQLAHAGCLAVPELTGTEPRGPSPLDAGEGPVGRAMDREEIEATVQAFAQAASRARQVGFDAVQVHAAHGYLLSQFLSPYANRRTDSYGGDIAGRARFLLEVIGAVRKAVGAGYPVLVKVNAEDFLPGGLSIEDMLDVAELLEAAGVDAVEMSGGTAYAGGLSFSRVGKPRPGQPEAYYEGAARRYKERVGVPLILVGGIRTYETAERLVAEGVTDYVALSRPFIREPHLVARWRAGDRSPAHCVSDNGCFDTGGDGAGIFCAVEARRRRHGASA